MASTICNITIDCEEPWRLAAFWSAVLALPVHPDNEPRDDEVGIPLPHGGELIFQSVPEHKVVKNRQHLCLRPADCTRDAEVERLAELGATLVSDLRRPDGSGWAVLADPESNEFCVLRRASELSAVHGNEALS
ncbi:MAG: VOC family protein [Chloroflexota bacterium]